MKLKHWFTDLFPKIVSYKAARIISGICANPITLTYSVTAACQSKCKTCNIGLRYQRNPGIVENDLTIGEIEKIFRSLGRVYFFNISGGEPFLRKDLPEIVGLACRYLRPKIIHIPTNAIASERINNLTTEILEVMKRHDPNVPLTVKPSIDGVGQIHDEVRGVKGNFGQLEKTIAYLKEIEKRYPNFHLELGTVISNFNIRHLSEIEDYVHSQGIQSYRNEIAERRAEFFNLDDPITPDPETYERLVREFAAKIRKNIWGKRQLTKITESLRLVYYDLAVRIMRESRQVIPCFAGMSNVHVNFDGEVWPCCVLGYSQPMGKLRDCGYDFRKIWHSGQAVRVRKHIAAGNCACPLANQSYSNILCDPGSMLKAVSTILKLRGANA